MKKILITFLILSSIIFSSTVFGDECEDEAKQDVAKSSASCKVEGGPSEKVSTYIEDLKTTFSELKNNLSSSANCGTGGKAVADLKQLKSILSDTNQITDFGGFLSSWEFYIAPIFKGEIVYPLYRDHDLLRKQQDNINAIEKLAAKNCTLSKKISGSKIKDTMGKYGLTKLDTIENVLSELRILNNKITNYYRCEVTGVQSCNKETESNNLQELESEIALQYKGCTAQNVTFKKFTCKIKKVIKNGIGFEKGIEEWKAALALVQGLTGRQKSVKYDETEKRLLAKELGKQGLSTETSAIIMKNLDNFNKCADNGISCFVKNISNSVVTVINDLEKIYDTFVKDNILQPSSTDTMSQKIEELGKLNPINKNLAEEYQRIKNQMIQSNVNLDKNIGTLLQIHTQLIGLNKNFPAGIKIAEEICTTCQKKGEGNCKFD